MSVQELIKNINGTLPTLQEIQVKVRGRLNENISIVEAEKYRNSMIVKYKKVCEPENKIDDLILNTNISVIGVGSLNFTNSIEIIENCGNLFAGYNEYLIQIFYNKNLEIFLRDSDTLKMEMISVSPDLFFDFLVLYSKIFTDKIFRQLEISVTNIELLRSIIHKGLSKKFLLDLVEELQPPTGAGDISDALYLKSQK